MNTQTYRVFQKTTSRLTKTHNRINVLELQLEENEVRCYVRPVPSLRFVKLAVATVEWIMDRKEE